MNNFRLIFSLFFALASIVIQAKNIQTIKTIDGKRYILDNGEAFVLDEKVLIVKPKTSLYPIPKDLKILNSNRLGFLYIQVPKNIDIEEYADSLRNSKLFDIIEFNGASKCCLEPNDDSIANQWYIDRIHLYEAWDITTGISDVKVAIIDTGVDANHVDLGYGFDSYTHVSTSLGYDYTAGLSYQSPSFFHGTFVAGILGAKTNNSIGIAGVSGGNGSAGITIIPYCMGNSGNFVTYYNANAILDAIDAGAKIINISMSMPQTTDVDYALEYAFSNGVSVVCATGNNGTDAISYPASNERTISVGAMNYYNLRRPSSNYGEGLDIIAPGESIYSTVLNHNYDYSSGTSFSAPQVSGVIALMLSVNPNLTPAEIRNILRNSANKISEYTYTNGWNQEVGYGLLDAYKAVIQAFNIHVVGSDMVCGEEEYTISNLPAGAAVALNTSNSAGFSIQVSNNLSIVSYSDGLLTVQKVSTGVGYIFVYYKGHLLTTREVWVGVPIVNDVYFMGGNIYIETVEKSTPDPRYFYIVINGRRYRLLGGVGTIPLTNGTYYVEAYTSNLCGESDHYFGQIVVYGSGLYSLGPISSDHQVTIETIDYSDSPQPLEAMQTMTSKQVAKDVPYELKNAMTGEVSARGEMPAEGGMLDFSRVRSGLYVLMLSPAGRNPETIKLSLK